MFLLCRITYWCYLLQGVGCPLCLSPSMGQIEESCWTGHLTNAEGGWKDIIHSKKYYVFAAYLGKS